MDIKKLRDESGLTGYKFTRKIAKETGASWRSVYNWLAGYGIDNKYKKKLIEIYGESKAETKGETDND